MRQPADLQVRCFSTRILCADASVHGRRGSLNAFSGFGGLEDTGAQSPLAEERTEFSEKDTNWARGFESVRVNTGIQSAKGLRGSARHPSLDVARRAAARVRGRCEHGARCSCPANMHHGDGVEWGATRVRHRCTGRCAQGEVTGTDAHDQPHAWLTRRVPLVGSARRVLIANVQEKDLQENQEISDLSDRLLGAKLQAKKTQRRDGAGAPPRRKSSEDKASQKASCEVAAVVCSLQRAERVGRLSFPPPYPQCVPTNESETFQLVCTPSCHCCAAAGRNRMCAHSHGVASRGA